MTRPADDKSSKLFAFVKGYEQLGNHRTGDPPEARTLEWASDILSSLGGRVEHHRYDFQHFNQETQVTIDGDPIPSLALYYSAAGSYACENPSLHPWKIDASRDDGTLRTTATTGSLQLIPTHGPTDAIYAPNRRIVRPGSTPAILVPGATAKALVAGAVEARFKATVKKGQSGNVLARFGPDRPPDLMLATSLSGWFRCAGERGTGLSLLFHLAAMLCENTSFVVVLTTGHELGYEGAMRLLGDRAIDKPGAVMHLGSSLATLRSPKQDAKHQWTRLVASGPRLGRAEFDDVADDLDLSSVHFPGDDSTGADWMGESRIWHEYGVPMVSAAGVHPQFHTPDDLSEIVTCTADLNRAAEVITSVADVLLKSANISAHQ